MNVNKSKKIGTRQLVFFSLGFLCLIISLLLLSCGTGPMLKVLDAEKCDGAIDFSTAPSDTDTPTDFSEVGSISTGQSIRSLATIPFTIESWIKRNTSSALNGGIFSRAVDEVGILLYIVDNEPRFGMKYDPASVTQLSDVNSGVPLYNGEWVHIAAMLVNENHSGVHAACDSSDTGRYTSIAIDSSNKMHISYYDVANANLMYATNASGVWVTTTVDSTGDVGMYTSIAIDSSDKAHISYFDNTNGDLKYATNASGSWVTSTVESTNFVGRYTSIAVDSSSKAYISYLRTYNAGVNGDLKYATNASGSWVTSTVESGGDLGWYTSIALDSSNKAYISYYDNSNKDLKYATNASGSWVTSTVESTGDVGQYSSIALDSSNKAYISYYDNTNGDLKYATNASGSWVTSTVDDFGNTGHYTSIALLSPGNSAHISYYYGGSIGDLKYATNSSGTWVTETADAGSGGGAESQTPHLDVYIDGVFANCASSDSTFSHALDLRPGTTTEVNEQIGASQVIGGPSGWQSLSTNISPSTRLNAVIDEVRFWSTARTQSQIQQCMTHELGISGGDCGINNNLIGYWKFNECSGASIQDHSGSGNSGTKGYCNNTDNNADGDVDDAGDINCSTGTAETTDWDGGWVTGYSF